MTGFRARAGLLFTLIFLGSGTTLTAVQTTQEAPVLLPWPGPWPGPPQVPRAYGAYGVSPGIAWLSVTERPGSSFLRAIGILVLLPAASNVSEAHAYPPESGSVLLLRSGVSREGSGSLTGR
jgi:hypothetical protein